MRWRRRWDVVPQDKGVDVLDLEYLFILNFVQVSDSLLDLLGG
jgi:hypothetical protein